MSVTVTLSRYGLQSRHLIVVGVGFDGLNSQVIAGSKSLLPARISEVGLKLGGLSTIGPSWSWQSPTAATS